MILDDRDRLMGSEVSRTVFFVAEFIKTWKEVVVRVCVCVCNE